MMDSKRFAAAMGFAFVAAWIAFSFGEALLCLLGAAACYAGAAVVQGELDLGELQDRLPNRSGAPVPPTRAGSARVR